jgi:hypothetical protein
VSCAGKGSEDFAKVEEQLVPRYLAESGNVHHHVRQVPTTTLAVQAVLARQLGPAQPT